MLSAWTTKTRAAKERIFGAAALERR